MNQITTTRPTPKTDHQQKTGDPVAVDPAPTACDIALEGMIVLLARHISREMTSTEETPRKTALRIEPTKRLAPHTDEA